MNTAAAIALPTFDVYTLAPETAAHVCTYACPRGEEIRAEVSVDENGQIRFAVTARPADVTPEQAQSWLRASLRSPSKPLGFHMRPGLWSRLRKQLAAGEVWMPRG
jgi:hypothetical protein